MCNSHLDHQFMIRDTQERVQGVTAPSLAPTSPIFARLWTALTTKISLLLKGFARV